MIKKIKINLHFLRNQKISLIYKVASDIGKNHPINDVRQLALKLCYDLQHNSKTIIFNLTDDEVFYMALMLFEIGFDSGDIRIIKFVTRILNKIERKTR